jgi:hypothetical protein
MRAVKPLGATISVILGGYLLLMAHGVVGAIKERAQGWEITPLPSHPVPALVGCLIGGIGLQFVSAWLLMPGATTKGTARFWPLCHYGGCVYRRRLRRSVCHPGCCDGSSRRRCNLSCSSDFNAASPMPPGGQIAKSLGKRGGI